MPVTHPVSTLKSAFNAEIYQVRACLPGPALLEGLGRRHEAPPGAALQSVRALRQSRSPVRSALPEKGPAQPAVLLHLPEDLRAEPELHRVSSSIYCDEWPRGGLLHSLCPALFIRIGLTVRRAGRGAETTTLRLVRVRPVLIAGLSFQVGALRPALWCLLGAFLVRRAVGNA